MQWLAAFQQDIIGHINQQTDRANAAERQATLHPVRTVTIGQALKDTCRITRTGRVIPHGHLCHIGNINIVFDKGRLWHLVGNLKHSRKLTGDADDAEQV